MTKSKSILSVDIEIADVFEVPEGADLDMFAPFHISVAGTAILGADEIAWYSKEEDGTPALHLISADALELLRYLKDAQEQGFRVCAWNGLSFDLKWIGYAAGDMKLAAEVALKLYDPMFQFFMLRGFPIGLGKAAEGLGIEQTKLMDGADAPAAWVAGDYQRVMDYVIGDCQITNKVVEAIEKRNAVQWMTQRGRLSAQFISKLETVETCMGWSLPDQSWMSTPLPVAKFNGWITEALANG